MPKRSKVLTHLARQILETCEEIERETKKNQIDFLLKSLQSELEIMRRLTRDMATRTTVEVVRALIDKHS